MEPMQRCLHLAGEAEQRVAPAAAPCGQQSAAHAAVAAAAAGGMWALALELLDEMWEGAVMPDAAAFNSTLRACPEWSQALRLLAQMRACGVRVSAQSLAPAARAALKGRRWQQALQLLGASCGGALSTPEGEELPHGAVLRACCRSRDWPLALEQLERLRQAPRDPEVSEEQHQAADEALEAAVRQVAAVCAGALPAHSQADRQRARHDGLVRRCAATAAKVALPQAMAQQGRRAELVRPVEPAGSDGSSPSESGHSGPRGLAAEDGRCAEAEERRSVRSWAG
mmetsp:Transcript_106276/g.300980  ORF Transcript_106276/g.300980 Transcript_106276/m.300980 type:complete len:284 (-) Transcript_106276:8-859(-)